jgi:hypothetical protein
MNLCISVGVVPMKPGPGPVWKTRVRIPAALRALANVFASASVAGLVTTIISSPQIHGKKRSREMWMAPLFNRPSARRRWPCSQGLDSSSLKRWDPPVKVTVTSTDLTIVSRLESGLYWAAAI